MDVYILQNEINSDVIEVCDDETNANQLKDNLLETGQYKAIYITTKTVNSDTIGPLSIVKIQGDYSRGTLAIYAYNPTTPQADKLEFNVSGDSIVYSGFVNLTTGETIEDLKPRIKTWVADEFKIRLENDN